jgi:hypothetical protein
MSLPSLHCGLATFLQRASGPPKPPNDGSSLARGVFWEAGFVLSTVERDRAAVWSR